MFDAYKVAVKLSLVNHVSTGLIAIAGEMSLLHKSAINAQGSLSGVEKKLRDIKLLGVVGAGLAGAGFAGMALLKGPYEEAKKLAQAKANFETLNLTASENAEAYTKAAAQSQKILGTNITDNVKAIHDLHTAFGDLHHAIRSSDDFAKYSFAAKIANGGKDVEGLVYSAVKALEHRGGKVINNDQTFRDELEMQSKVQFGSKGKVSGSDFFAASQTGKMAYTMYDKEYLYGQFAAYMQAKSGATAGTAGMTAFSSLIGGHMDNKAKGFLSELGLLEMRISPHAKEMRRMLDAQTDPDMKKALAKMGLLTPITASLNDQNLNLFAHRPDKFINDVLVPAIRKKYGMDKTDEEVALIISKSFNRNTSDFLGEHIVNGNKFAKDAAIFQKSMGFAAAYEHFLKSPQGAEEAASKAWKNLSTVIGTIYLPKITDGLLSLASGLTSLIDIVQKYPNVTKTLIYGFIGLSAALAFGGSVMLLTAAFRGLSLAIATPGLLKGVQVLGTQMSFLGKAGAVVAAGAAGYALGTMIYDLAIQGTKFGDWLGSFVAKILAIMGSSEAKAALKGNGDKEWSILGGSKSARGNDYNNGHTVIPGRSGFMSMLMGGHHESKVTNVAPPPSAGQPVQVTTKINLDGRPIAEVVSKHQAKDMARAPVGANIADGTMNPFPVGFSYGY